ncbi:2-oxoglutarate and iron-dependent oxygenase domain-containing protein ICU11 isoform X3 [Vigna angularis]|uniref:2-oxoglutarate and iron-dependent oxygenase domain-containing protein ICU11 isoform X3 n=1 Tax=Phaseolus angularis TaxID=3914 RepID=UPI0022B325F7|nr:2-oxoglutarate and iron-dependent oxygenase domain-containing protein ICU11 isoform X3 [Vigna angularis]
MSQNQHSVPQQPRPSGGHVTARVVNLNSDRLCVSPKRDHKSENYEDLQLDFNPHVFGSLEQYLPPHVLNLSREVKVRYMRNILLRYFPENDRNRIQKLREYRLKIILNYPVDSFERWVRGTKLRIMRPSTMNKHGVVLEDFGLETMLDRFMSDIIHPISRVFYSEFGGSSLDSHHGFVVEYGISKDLELGLHVDDAEVSLNVCLGKEFSGGEVFFQGVRCEEHVLSIAQPGEIFNYSHVPGHAILHPGRQRHGARPTTSGNRMNLIIWCRSSAFRELKKYQRDFPSWCGECKRKKKERARLSLMVSQQELLKREI